MESKCAPFSKSYYLYIESWLPTKLPVFVTVFIQKLFEHDHLVYIHHVKEKWPRKNPLLGKFGSQQHRVHYVKEMSTLVGQVRQLP